MKREELNIIVKKHKDWLDGNGGECANLRGADLQGADLDHSVLPLWCGSLTANMDDRQVIQLLYHVLSVVKHSDNVSSAIKEVLLTEQILEVAKRFHRANKCKKL